jgi:acyl-CoA synthetase (AMP-forming)/AMP-acid ligase II
VEFNLADLFECVAGRVAERVAVCCGTRRLTYRELDRRASQLAHALGGLGVATGDNVGLFLHNCVEFLEAMLACFKLRAVPVNVNYRYTGEELAHVASDADLVAVFHHRSLCPAVASARALAGVRLVVVEEAEAEPTGCGLAGCLAYEELLSRGDPHTGFGPRSADDHYILYTGGTTGWPKGVVWRHEDIFFATLGGGNPGGPPISRPEQIAETVVSNRAQRVGPFLPEGHPGPPEFVCLPLGPLVHASGQWSALSTLLGGGRLVLYPHRHMDMDLVLRLVAEERVCMLNLVGDASGRPLLEALDRPGASYDTSSLLLLGSGGSILSGEVKDALLARLPSVLAISEAVGSSEAPVQAVAVGQRTGRPSPSLRFAARPGATMVLDEELRPVAPGSGQVGRLATTGHVPLAYYKDPERSAATFVEIDGRRWSIPGDMATVEADGTIRLLGRGSLCINTGGEKVYPEEVEAALKSHPAVADAVVVGRPSPRWGEEVVALVSARPGARPVPLAELVGFCRGQLAGYKLPKEVAWVDHIPRSPAGKADYDWARRQVSA